MSRRLAVFCRTLVVAPLFMAIWVYVVPRLAGGREAFDHPRPLGWIIVAAGALIGLPCVWEFVWRGLGTPAPFDPPKKLVVTGPYRFVRNPMYLGLALVLIGEAVVFPNVTIAMLVLTAVMCIAVTLFVIRVEEPALRKMFGAEYEAYCRQVGRWIPRLRPFDNASNAAVQ